MNTLKALQRTMEKYRDSIDLEAATGMHKQHISRLRTSDNSITTKTLDTVVNALPPEAKAYYLYLLTQPEPPGE